MGANFAQRRLGKELTKVCLSVCVCVFARARARSPQSWSVASLGEPLSTPATTLDLGIVSRELTEMF